MDNSSPAAPGKTPAANEPLTSHTVNFGTDGEANYDQTIKVKVPGTGMTVFNRYKLQRVLGRGGMGIVWLADDLKLERPVALKFLPSLIGLDPAAVKELKTETRRGLELSHPNIVRIYDFVDDDDAAAISMEFVDGKTLSEMRSMTEHGIFTVEEIARWLPGVCDALDYAHFQRKVVHRDLKPANIMLTAKDDVAKVADFGIARSLSDTMSRLSAAHIGTSGTLPYMSPQQAMGERPLPTDDVYSLGATIYELLAGKPPFYRGDLPTQINSKIPPPMAERRRELEISPKDAIPKLWEEAIAACLNKDPNLRPSCAGMLMEMLGLRPTSSTSRTISFASSGGSSRAKPKSKAPVLAAALVAVMAVGGSIWYATQKKPVAVDRPVAVTPKSEPSPVVASPTPQEEAKPAPKAEPSTVAENKAPAPVTPKAPPAVENTPPAPAPAPPSSPTVATVTPSAPAPVMAGPPSTTAPAATPPTSLPAPSGDAVPAANPSAPGGTAAMPPAPGPAAPAVAGVTPQPSAGPVTVAAVTQFPPPAPPLPLSPELQAAAATMPAQPTLPPGVIPPGYSPPVPAQPLVSDPPSGFWTLDQLYPTQPFATYSAPGRKYLLYRTQGVLKEKGLYTSAVDGKEGKSTHNAIQLFQAKSGLKPTGLLDMPTLAALQLAAEPDNIDWMSPASIPVPPGSRRPAGGGRYSRPQETEDPTFLERAGDRLKGILGR